jgi:hypothetical protein
MSEDNEKQVNVVLWGDTQVGKTTALATYLCHDESRPDWIDHGAPETFATMLQLSTIWNSLRSNELQQATLNAKLYSVRHKDQRLFHFRDMRGSNAGEPVRGEEDIREMRRADALIVFIQWPEGNTVSQLLAVEHLLNFALARDCPRALAVTKVESYLTPERLTEFSLNPVRVASEMDLDRDFIRILRRFNSYEIAPVSVYGYSERDGYPAHYQDEFGRYVPWQIRPVNVDLPFRCALGPLL